ncbi:hypothetical protein DV735_g3989, partial [Chaetothyriales sp. CBS 134920]
MDASSSSLTPDENIFMGSPLTLDDFPADALDPIGVNMASIEAMPMEMEAWQEEAPPLPTLESTTWDSDLGFFDMGAFDMGAFDMGTFDMGAFDMGAFDMGALPLSPPATLPASVPASPPQPEQAVAAPVVTINNIPEPAALIIIEGDAPEPARKATRKARAAKPRRARKAAKRNALASSAAAGNPRQPPPQPLPIQDAVVPGVPAYEQWQAPMAMPMAMAPPQYPEWPQMQQGMAQDWLGQPVQAWEGLPDYFQPPAAPIQPVQFPPVAAQQQVQPGAPVPAPGPQFKPNARGSWGNRPRATGQARRSTAAAAASSSSIFRRLLSNEVRIAIDRAVASAPVVLFMKGTPETPQCGFSRTSIQILGMQGVDPAKFTAFNVLEDADLRSGIKEYSDWPTIPQLYVDKQFVGGCDILMQMHRDGSLADLLAEKKVIIEEEPEEEEPAAQQQEAKEKAA